MSSQPSAPDASAARPVFRRALRDALILLAVLAVAGPVVGWFVAGSHGVWGALVGVVLAAVFSLATPLVMLATLRSPLVHVTGLVLGVWLAKAAIVVVVLALARGAAWLDTRTLGVVLLVGVLGSLAADLRAVSGTRVPYVAGDPGDPGPSDPDLGEPRE